MTAHRPQIPRIEWPTAAVLLGVLASMTAVWALASPEQRADLLTGVGALGSVVLAVMRAMLSLHAPPPPPPSAHGSANGLDHDPLDDDRPSRLPPALRVAAAVLVIAALPGCGASALRTHARVAVVASSALAVSHATLVETCAALRDSCAGDAACIAPHRERCEDAAVAQDGARDAVAAYIGALEVAHLADGEADVLGALMLALDVARRAWEGAARALAALGIALPALPGGGS